MGLVIENEKTVVLSDILGMEDALGDMDFKVAGSRDGITAFQMDIKVEGITFDIMKEALERALKGRMYILDKMDEIIAQPREQISPYAPRIEIIQIQPDKIGTLIGPGGKTIRKITDETKVEINIDDSGKVSLYSNNMEMMEKAKKMVEDITAEVEVGKIYRGVVKNIMDFGAFVEILPGQQGLVHISSLADYRVDRVEDVVQTGDEIMVKVTEIDNRGRINLSRRDAIEGEEGRSGAPPRRHDTRRYSDDRTRRRPDERSRPRSDDRGRRRPDRDRRSSFDRGSRDRRERGGSDRYRR
jgi:polyribonucleotide nucleotidyltransferase